MFWCSISVVLFSMRSSESCPRGVTWRTEWWYVERVRCLSGMTGTTSSPRVGLVYLEAIRSVGVRGGRDSKLVSGHTLCRSIMSFAMHAGGPVSRTGFPIGNGSSNWFLRG